MSFTLKSSQTIAVVAIAAALVAGAYAVGRSQNASLPAPPLASAEVATADKSDTASPAAPQPVKADIRAPQAQPSKLCAGCLRVVSVHSVAREGQGSGLGAIGGAVIGGILGNQVGGGNGRKIATVGGAVAGGYAGNEIEKRSKTSSAWVVTLSDANGHRRTHEQARKPDLQSGDIVVLQDGELQRR